MPRIDDMVKKMATYSLFSTYDLKSAYHQVPMKVEDRPYTAFESNNKLYQFTRMTFGLANAVAGFQRTLDKIVEKEELKDIYICR